MKFRTPNDLWCRFQILFQVDHLQGHSNKHMKLKQYHFETMLGCSCYCLLNEQKDKFSPMVVSSGSRVNWGLHPIFEKHNGPWGNCLYYNWKFLSMDRKDSAQVSHLFFFSFFVIADIRRHFGQIFVKS